MNTEELFKEISGLFEEAKKYHESKFKKDKREARKALSKMKKLIQSYNKISVVENK